MVNRRDDNAAALQQHNTLEIVTAAGSQAGLHRRSGAAALHRSLPAGIWRPRRGRDAGTVSGDDGDYEEASATPREIICITVPGDGAPRGQQIKGCVMFSWDLPVEQAQHFEDHLTRHNPTTRIRVRVYRGERELKPQIGESNESLPMTPPADETSATLRLHIGESSRHLDQLRRSIDQEQARLAEVRAELAKLQTRRDDEVTKLGALVSTIQTQAFEDIKKARTHASLEMQRAQLLDGQVGMQLTSTWAQLASNNSNLNIVRDMLQRGLLADRTKEYLNVAKTAVSGLADSQFGRMVGMRLAASLSDQVNKKLAPDQPGTTPEDAIAAAVIFGAAFNERRAILREYAVRHGGREGQALTLGLEFAFGEQTGETFKAFLGLDAAPSATPASG